MQMVTTIGLDIASRFFRCTALMLPGKWSFAVS
jgi:hypothetical protein